MSNPDTPEPIEVSVSFGTTPFVEVMAAYPGITPLLAALVVEYEKGTLARSLNDLGASRAYEPIVQSLVVRQLVRPLPGDGVWRVVSSLEAARRPKKDRQYAVADKDMEWRGWTTTGEEYATNSHGVRCNFKTQQEADLLAKKVRQGRPGRLPLYPDALAVFCPRTR